MRSRRLRRSASSTASASVRAHLSTAQSSTGTSAAPRSRQPRSSPRSFATARCAACTPSIPITASPPTSATSPRATPRSFASVDPRTSTAARSRRSAMRTSTRSRNTKALGTAAERRASFYYLLRGYRIVARNARAAGNEIDLIVRRGRKLAFCEVKLKSGDRYGDPAEMVGWEKQSEEHTSELQSRENLVCRLLLEK